MFDGVFVLFAAARSIEPAQSGVATPQLIPALLFVVLGVAAMFWALFGTNWLRAMDPTDVMEQRRRRRFLHPEHRAA